MRLDLIAFAGVVAIAMLTAGCSSDTSQSASSSSATTSSTSSAAQAQSTSSAPSPTQTGPLDDSTCFDIGFAKDNLMVARKPEDARRAADTLEKYGPPDQVKAAIEHFVTTVGAQPDDAALDTNRDLITNWVKQLCPNLKP